MEFSQPYWFLLLLLLPVLFGIEWKRSRSYTGLKYSSTESAAGVRKTIWTRMRLVPLILRSAGLILLVFALARPQVKNVTRERFAEGLDIIMVLDTSTSMRAQDFKPNRFEAAREVGKEFIDARTSDRIGLVVFAAKAYTQTPLTLDYEFLKRMMDEVDVGVIEDGTAIGTALAMATNRLKDTEAKSKVVILLTDGQNNRGEVDPVTAAEVAEALNVRVYAIGVGAHGQAPVVIDHPFAGRQRRMMEVDIDEDMLKSVAAKTGGKYFRATNKEGLRTVYEEIGELEKTKIEERVYTDFEERYPVFLWPALGLFLIEIALASTRLRRFP